MVGVSESVLFVRNKKDDLAASNTTTRTNNSLYIQLTSACTKNYVHYQSIARASSSVCLFDCFSHVKLLLALLGCMYRHLCLLCRAQLTAVELLESVRLSVDLLELLNFWSKVVV